jgi:hypothetical protein
MNTNGLQTFEVESESQAALVYLVRFHRDLRWSCSCPDYLYRRVKLGDVCKHIRRIVEQQCSRGWGERCPKSTGKRCRCQCGGYHHGTYHRRQEENARIHDLYASGVRG